MANDVVFQIPCRVLWNTRKLMTNTPIIRDDVRMKAKMFDAEIINCVFTSWLILKQRTRILLFDTV